MKNILTLTFLGLALASSSFAMNAPGSVWSCGDDTNQNSALGRQWCRALITSGTTAAQLGRVSIDANKVVTVVGGVSGSAVANLVTPTLNYQLKNAAVATQSISVTTAGNIVYPVYNNAAAWFNGITVSESIPSNISSTNGIYVTIIETDK